MAAVVSMLILFLSLSLAFGAEPGVKLAVTNKGLGYVNELAGAALRKKLQTLNIPPQDGMYGKTGWTLRNIYVNSVSGPNTGLSLYPVSNGVSLSTNNFNINFNANWETRYRIIWRFKSRGSVDFKVTGVSVTVVARLGQRNGLPSVTSQSCSCSIGDIEIKIRGGFVGWIYNIFRKKIATNLKGILRKKVCENVNNLVNTRADNELATMKVSAEIARRFIMDYSLTRAPIVTENHIDIACEGLVYWKGNRRGSPFTAAALPALNEISKMLYMYITEYSANTFLYVAHVNGYLQYNMTVNKLPFGSSQLLDPTGELKDLYPDSKLELRISSSSAPSVKFNYGTMTTSAVANVEVVVHTPHELETPFTLRVSASVTIRPSVVNGLLTASIADYTLNIAVIQSSIGEINEQELNTLIRAVTDLVVVPKLNEIGRQGIDLPVTGIFRLYNTQLNLWTGYLQVATDVVYLT